MFGLVLLVLLVLLFVGAIPLWPHSRAWGYYPSSALGLAVLAIILVLIFR